MLAKDKIQFDFLNELVETNVTLKHKQLQQSSFETTARSRKYPPVSFSVPFIIGYFRVQILHTQGKTNSYSVREFHNSMRNTSSHDPQKPFFKKGSPGTLIQIGVTVFSLYKKFKYFLSKHEVQT